MKKRLLLTAILFLFSAGVSGAQDCDEWPGQWNVTHADGTTREWIINKTIIRDSGQLPCGAMGVSINEEGEYASNGIYYFNMFSQFMYTEEELDGANTPSTFIDLDGDTFTANPNGLSYVYDIVSGERVERCMTVSPESATVDGYTTAEFWITLTLSETSWADDETMKNAVLEAIGDSADYISVREGYVVDGPSRTVMVHLSISQDAPSGFFALVLKDSTGGVVCNAGFEIISTADDDDDDGIDPRYAGLIWGRNGVRESQFVGPHGIAVDSEGNVFVADQRNDRIQKFDSEGNFITVLGSAGYDNGNFRHPTNIAIDSENNLYVADQKNYRLQKFDSEGNHVLTWGPGEIGTGFLREAASIAVDDYGNVYIADIWQSLLLNFDSDGNFITAWAFPSGNIDPDAFRPTCLAIDSSGNIYMTDYLNNHVLKFDPFGSLIVSYGSEGSGEGEFSYPNGIAVDSEDNVYVVDTLNNRIQKFDASGTFVTAWGDPGDGYGEMNTPFGITIGSDNNLYLTDTFNHRVQKFSTSGPLEIEP